MTTALIVPPANEPLSLADVKEHLRVTHDHEDTLIAQTLTAARQYTEFATGQKLITQVWRQYESALPADGLVALQVSPVQSVQTVTLFDSEGSPHVLAQHDAQLVRGEEGYLRVSQGVDPALSRNGAEIDLVTGLGDLGVDVPHTLKRAILLLVAHWYEFRGAVSPQEQPVSLPPGFDRLVAPFRRAKL